MYLFGFVLGLFFDGWWSGLFLLLFGRLRLLGLLFFGLVFLGLLLLGWLWFFWVLFFGLLLFRRLLLLGLLLFWLLLFARVLFLGLLLFGLFFGNDFGWHWFRFNKAKISCKFIINWINYLNLVLICPFLLIACIYF